MAVGRAEADHIEDALEMRDQSHLSIQTEECCVHAISV
jgi:hypothetical protein